MKNIHCFSFACEINFYNKIFQVNSSYAVGDMERAQKASETARRYSIYSIVAGSIIEIAIIALVVIRFTVQFSSTTRYT